MGLLEAESYIFVALWCEHPWLNLQFEIIYFHTAISNDIMCTFCGTVKHYNTQDEICDYHLLWVNHLDFGRFALKCQ